MAEDFKEERTRTFEFANHQITVDDAAMLLGCGINDIITLIKLNHLKAEGKRPYKVDAKSVVAYKRAMIGAAEAE